MHFAAIKRAALPAFAATLAFLLTTSASLSAPIGEGRPRLTDRIDVHDLYDARLSSFGLLARMATTGRLAPFIARARARGGKGRIALKMTPQDTSDEDSPIPGGQAEMAIAVDPTGQNVVVGFNDSRGFLLDPFSVSGYAWSSDGGLTFTDGGQLPASQQGTIGTTALPQVFGDPDVKYVPGGAGCQFIYASIEVIGIGGIGSPPNVFYSGEAQSMSIHRSTDCGHTWAGPFTVTAATNPSGVLISGSAQDAADKEFIDVDPATGRVLMSWTNFTATSVTTPSGLEIRTAFSDNIMSGNPPTWSSGVVLNPGAADFDSGSMPRFAGGGKVYVVWGRDVSNELTPYGFAFYGNIMFSRSPDNGQTWSAPIKLHTDGAFPITGDFFPIDQIPGNDRIHSFPFMAVDLSGGAHNGNIYVLYAANDAQDGSDVYFVKSTNDGTSFSAPVRLNARPGADRSQWFPSVSVSSAGRIYAIFYDQQFAPDGDLTEMTMTFSDDAGATWTRPSPISRRPFHAGYGNDTGQPNLGDYIGSTTNGASLLASWASTPPQVPFTDGEPASTSFTVPDFDFARTSAAAAALKLGTVVASETAGFSNGNGFFDPGERISLSLPVVNYVTNAAAGAGSYASVNGTLSSTTPGVAIVSGVQSYGTIAAGATAVNAAPFVISLPGNFVAGTPLELTLSLATSSGSASLRFTFQTGTPVPAPLFSENFDATTPGSLPPGWTTLHIGQGGAVPWTTDNAFCNTGTNALFHVDTGFTTRFEIVATPTIVVPPSSTPQIVTLDFDLCYETEDDPDYNVNAYDGATVRLVDNTAGRLVRSVLAEAFAQTIQTGNAVPFRNHFPKHLPRNNTPEYFQDMSVWAGSSGGIQHVHMEFPGMQDSTIKARWEFTQDSFGSCLDAGHAGYGGVCGVMVDNIVMKTVVFDPALVDLSFTTASAAPATVTPGNNVTYTYTVAASASGFNAANAAFDDNLPPGETFVSLASPAGWLCTTPAVGAVGTIHCTHPSVPSAASATFTIVAHVPPSAAVAAVNNVATIATDSIEVLTGNNSGTAMFNIGTAQAELGIVNTAPAFALAGGDLAYSMNVQNGGPSDAQSLTLGFTLPGATTFVSISAAAGWLCTTPAIGSGGSVSCTRPALAASGTGAFTLTVHIPSGTADGTLLATSATIGSTSADPVSGNNASLASTGIVRRVLDVDGNAAYDPLTDGLLIVRHLLGISGPQLVAGVVGSGAARSDATTIGNFLAAMHPLLDIDDDGHVDVATDGVLIVRYLLGYRDDALVAGALGANASRLLPDDVKAYLDSLAP